MKGSVLSEEAAQMPGLFHQVRTQPADGSLKQVEGSHQATTALAP